MNPIISNLVDRFERGALTRRELVQGLTMLAAAGGAASAFRAIAAERDADVWAVQYPGREDRAGEPLPTSLTQLVDEGVDAVATMCAERRIDGFVLVGASMGGLVAFEVAQRLQTLGHPARALADGHTAGLTRPYR